MCYNIKDAWRVVEPITIYCPWGILHETIEIVVHGTGQCLAAAGFEQDMSGGALQPVKEEHEGGTAAEEELKREEPQPM